MSLSIVTVCMNRRQHLLVTAPQVAAWPNLLADTGVFVLRR